MMRNKINTGEEKYINIECIIYGIYNRGGGIWIDRDLRFDLVHDREELIVE